MNHIKHILGKFKGDSHKHESPAKRSLEKFKTSENRFMGSYKGGKHFDELKTNTKHKAVEDARQKQADQAEVFGRRMTPMQYYAKWGK